EVKELLRQKYEQQYKTEGRQEGRQEGQRRSLERVLRKRFQPLTSEQVAALEGVTDLARLEELMDEAVTCSSLTAFFATLSALQPGI
ncbi:MAG: hypothetical protein LC104_13860, partial [Bacteroidales bacterium]|nr:hypothetical protein [Bacteroidales bacterium]